MANAEVSLGAGPTPLVTQLGPTQAFQPESVAAEIDGSGAAGDFVMLLTLRAQDGTLLSSTRTDDTVTAGDSTEATFAPF